jgi:hypothetical protein
MKHKSTNKRWFNPSSITESKPPQSFVQAILDNSDIHQTMQSECYEQGTMPIKAPRTPERERYSISCVGIDEMLSDRGGESNAR